MLLLFWSMLACLSTALQDSQDFRELHIGQDYSFLLKNSFATALFLITRVGGFLLLTTNIYGKVSSTQHFVFTPLNIAM